MNAGIKQNIGEIAEVVVKPIADEVGKAIEQGVQSVVGSTAKPADPAAEHQGRPLDEKKQEEELKRRQWAVHTIQHFKKIDEEQKKVREGQKQKEVQVKKEEEEKKKVKQYELMKKRQQQLPQQVAEAQRRTEIKKGVGG